MAYLIESGLQVSLNYNPSTGSGTWYSLTDHNREPIDTSIELIETQSRMANGKMRKYVVSKKNTISASWKYVPSKTSECVDGNNGAAWIESFYNSNAGIPIYLKVVSSKLDPDSATGSTPSGTFITAQGRFTTAQTGLTIYPVFMSNFSKTIINRTRLSDYVDMSIEFTEI
jgi:hypothetical protein